MYIVAQVIGIIAMIFNVLSYQGRTQRQIMIVRLISAVLFVAHFWLLGGMTGATLNIIATLMCLVFAFKPKKFADSIFWIPFFIICTIIAYVLTFTVFGTEPTAFNLIINLFPVAGMTICIFAFRMDKASKVRLLSLFSSPCWLVYNIINVAIGAILTESFAICSNIFAIFTQDVKRVKKDFDKNKQADDNNDKENIVNEEKE